MKRKIALFLSLVMLMTSVGVLAQSTVSDKIQWLIDRGWVLGRGGDEGLALNEEITRAELTKMLVIIEGDQVEAQRLNKQAWYFSDLPDDHWAMGYINLAANKKYILGYEDGTFRPDKPISYNEAMALMSRLHPNWREDMDEKAIWPDTYVDFASKYGIIEGVGLTPGVYGRNALRSYIFEMIYNLYHAEEVKSLASRWDQELISVTDADKFFYDGRNWVAYSLVEEDGTLTKDHNKKTFQGQEVYYDFYHKTWKRISDGASLRTGFDALTDFGSFYDHRDKIWRSSRTNAHVEAHDFSSSISEQGDLRIVARPPQEGYKFASWDIDYPSRLNLTNNQIKSPSIDLKYSQRPSARVSLRPIYERVEDITIRLDENHSNISPKTMTYKATDTVEALPRPTREGHIFDGWYDRSTRGSKVEGRLENYKDRTLYARWTQLKTYQITVNPANGQETYKVKINPNTQIRDMVNAPTRDGYRFLGWKDQAGDWIDNRSATRDMRITGVWEKVRPNYSGLRDEIARAQEIYPNSEELGTYIWEDFAQARTRAQEVYRDSNASQDQIDKAVVNMRDTYNRLMERRNHYSNLWW